MTTFVKDYDVYHDESLIAGYWHGILFVPRHTRHRLLGLLASARTFTKHSDPVSLKSLNKPTGKVWRTVNCWLHIGIAALIQKLKGQRYPILTGQDKQTPGFDLLETVIGARFILFRVRDGLSTLGNYTDYGAKVETTYRMAFKGGLAMFANQGDQLCIRALHFDGHEHYGRGVDIGRILNRIGAPPAGVVLHENLILDDRSSDHRLPGSQAHDDCQLLQLTDLLVGGFRTVLGESKNDAQRQVCSPLLQLSDRWNQGAARMRNSKWNKGFCLSEGFIKNDKWEFEILQRPAVSKQPSLFNTE